MPVVGFTLKMAYVSLSHAAPLAMRRSNMTRRSPLLTSAVSAASTSWPCSTFRPSSCTCHTPVHGGCGGLDWMQAGCQRRRQGSRTGDGAQGGAGVEARSRRLPASLQRTSSSHTPMARVDAHSWHTLAHPCTPWHTLARPLYAQVPSRASACSRVSLSPLQMRTSSCTRAASSAAGASKCRRAAAGELTAAASTRRARSARGVML